MSEKAQVKAPGHSHGNVTENGGAHNSSADFELGEFFPYLVRVYYRAVSVAVSSAYEGEPGLSVSEWRTMAVLGPLKAMSAGEIVARSSMDKVTVSRAIKGLQARKLLKRDIDDDDKRRAVLRLTQLGRTNFRTIVPRIEKLTRQCLAGLSHEEQGELISLMGRVRKNAEALSNDEGGK